MEEKPECWGKFPKVAPTLEILIEKGCVVPPEKDWRSSKDYKHIIAMPGCLQKGWDFCKYWTPDEECCLYNSWSEEDEKNE